MQNATAPLNITIEGTVYDIEDFELGELEWMEDHLGMGIDEATPMKQAIAFVACVKRRDNPGFTFDDARKLKLRALDQPQNGNGSGNGRKRPTRAAKAASAAGNSGASS